MHNRAKKHHTKRLLKTVLIIISALTATKTIRKQNKLRILASVIFAILFSAPADAQLLKNTPEIKPPIAEKQTHLLKKFGDKRNDDYFWLSDRKNPKVTSYLQLENQYFASKFEKLNDLKETINKEIRSRIKEDDSSQPLKRGPYNYYTRFVSGLQYPIYARKTNDVAVSEPTEEVIFNVNELAAGKPYYQAEVLVSPDHKSVALVFDTAGRRFFSVQIKNLQTGKFLKHVISDITSNIIWSNDSRFLYYVKQDSKTLRFSELFRYEISSGVSKSIYREKDSSFEVFISTGLYRKHLLVNLSSTLTNELRTLDLDDNNSKILTIRKREAGQEFSVTEDEKYFYFLSNRNAKNFKVSRIEFAQREEKDETTIIENRADTFIDSFLVFAEQIVLLSHRNGLSQIEVYNKKTLTSKKIEFNDGAYAVELGENAEYQSPGLRFVYQSLRRPPGIYEWNFKSQKYSLLKSKEIPNFNSEDYTSDRIFVNARDGARIPVSILRKKGISNNGKAPLLLYGYGAYGSSSDPWFSVDHFSLVDRGFVYAIAHVRGGAEMGRFWTDDGRGLNKMNSFFDFIDVTEALITAKIAAPDKVFAMGASAGGLLVGAVTNLRPDLYRGIVAEVPFVDVLTTMLDSSIPLTTSEYDEWGNPNVRKFYDYIRKYSPYDNIKAQSYPNILITTGFVDSQVQFWEPAKWAAKLRAYNTDPESLIFLKTDFKSGHGGKSGRFDQIDESATNFAFILGLLP